MTTIRRLVLDVLKPHKPNAVEFSAAVVEKVPGGRVNLTVTAVDEKTESIVLIVEGENLSYDAVRDAIAEMGGTIHSIDAVDVENALKTRSD